MDGRRLVILTEEDGRDLDFAAGHILVSLCSIFPNIPTEYAACCFVISSVSFILCLQCFDAVGWAAGRASGL